MKAMSSATGATGGFVMKADSHDGVMMAFMVPPEIGKQLLDLARESGLPEEALSPLDELHVTLAFLGDTEGAGLSGKQDALRDIAKSFAEGWPALSGSINGIGRFMDAEDQDCLWANFDSPDLTRFRQSLVTCLTGSDFEPVASHGYTPHISLAYIPKEMPTPHIALEPIAVTFDCLTLAWGDDHYDVPLGTQGDKAMPDAAKVSLDGDDDSALIKIGHMVSFTEAGAIRVGQVTGIANGVANITVAGQAFTRPLSDLEPTPADDHPGEYDENGTGEEAIKARRKAHGNYNASVYGDVPSGEAPAATASEGDSYAYPDEQKLPMPDAQHVILAAAALGPNPPRGNQADIPKDKLGEVKGRIRARAHALGLSKEDTAKVNAYLAGHLPGEKMSSAETRAWTDVFSAVLAETQDEDKAACAAQGVLNRRTALGMKAVDGLPTTVEGWAVLFSDPADLDLQGTYFDDMTNLLVRNYANAPLWMEHGKDQDYGVRPIGERYITQVYPHGVWLGHRLYTDHPFYTRTATDAKNGKFSYSSDSLAHYAAAGFNPDDGYLGEWPLAGCSLTKTPAEPGLGPVTAKSFADALKSFGAAQEREATGVQAQDGMKPLVYGEKAMGNETPLNGAQTLELPPEEIGIEEPLGLKSVPEVPVEDGTKGEPEIMDPAVQKDDDGEATMAAPDENADWLPGANEQNDNFDGPDLDSPAPANTLEALGQMYGVDAQPEPVRKAMDDHISQMHATGQAHPDLCKALGLPSDSKAEDVANHLNNLYSAAVTPQKDDMSAAPEPVMSAPEPNYGVLHRHLHSGGPAAKSVGIFMTGNIAQKGINPLSGITKTPLTAFYADLLRIQRMERPRYIIGNSASKAMTSATGPTGGYVLQQEIVPDVLDPLRPQSVCFQLGAEKIDLQGLAVKTVPIMNSAPDANWVGENQSLSDTQPAYRTVTMIPHGLSVLVKVPFNVEANMTPSAEKQLNKQMAKSIALKIDKAAQVGTGGALAANGGAEIVGILNTPTANIYDMGTNGRIPSFVDIGNAFGLLDDANVPYDDGSRRGIALHSAISRAFTLATDALGNPLLRPAWRAAAEREIMAMPYAISNQISTTVTQGSATNASYIFGGDWQYMYIGLSDQVEVRLDQTFAGNLQAGLLIYVYADVKIVYPQAFFTMKGVLPPTVSGVTTSTNTLS
jgi:HK97 family phage major capsid protein/2'-5' RNA ligase